jgi:hypothetical protein
VNDHTRAAERLIDGLETFRRNALESAAESNSQMQPANLVDGLFELARAVRDGFAELAKEIRRSRKEG